MFYIHIVYNKNIENIDLGEARNHYFYSEMNVDILNKNIDFELHLRMTFLSYIFFYI